MDIVTKSCHLYITCFDFNLYKHNNKTDVFNRSVFVKKKTTANVNTAQYLSDKNL